MPSYKPNEALPDWLREMTTGFINEIKSQRECSNKGNEETASTEELIESDLIEDMEIEESTGEANFSLIDEEEVSKPIKQEQVIEEPPAEDEFDCWFDNRKSAKNKVDKPVEKVTGNEEIKGTEARQETDILKEYNLEYDEQGHLIPKRAKRIHYEF